MKKRLFSLTAGIAMLLTVCPISVFAESIVIDESAFDYVPSSSSDLTDTALWEQGYGVLVTKREYAGIAIRAENLSALSEICGYQVGWIPDGEWSTSAEEYDVSLQTIGNSMTNWITLKMDPTVSGDKPISTVLDCDFDVNDPCIGVCNVVLKSGMTAEERKQAKIDFCKAAAESDEVELLGLVYREADYHAGYSGVIYVRAKEGMEYQMDVLAQFGDVFENTYEGHCSIAILEIADAYAARDALMAEHSDWIESIELGWDLAESTDPQGVGVAAEIVAFDTAAEETYSLGDVTMDGVLDSADAIDVLMYYTTVSILRNESPFTEAQIALANVDFATDANNDIDTRDAVWIIQYYIYTMLTEEPVASETFFADFTTYWEALDDAAAEDAYDQALEESYEYTGGSHIRE